jgi:hypothetical protein
MARRPGTERRNVPASAEARTLPLSGIDTTVIGLDLSLTQAAACSVPVGWNLDWSRVRWMTAGGGLKREATPKERIERLRDIADALASFVVKTPGFSTGGVIHLMVEQYTFGTSFGAHSAGEIGGVVRLRLYERTGLILTPVIATSARKLMLGKNPRSTKEAKDKVVAFLQLAGASNVPNADAADAFVVANYKLCEWGVGLMV